MNEILGIVDRGIGGLGLYKQLRGKSNRPIIYFADNISTPYGLVEKTELKARLDKIISVLKNRNANKVLLACNSASVVFPDTDEVKGIIPFGVSSLMSAHANNPALIATKGTVNSSAYRRLFDQLGVRVTEQIAQQFAILVENGITSGDILEREITKVMQPLTECDAILMACTHFPAIKPLLQQYVHPNCQLIDPVVEMARWIDDHWPYLLEQPLQTRTQYLVTGSASQFIQSAKSAFSLDIDPTLVISLQQI